MNALLLADQTEPAGDRAGTFAHLELSRTEIAINHWIDIAEKWLDHYVVTPLLGPNQSALR